MNYEIYSFVLNVYINIYLCITVHSNKPASVRDLIRSLCISLGKYIIKFFYGFILELTVT